jgi:hypothetical protein
MRSARTIPIVLLLLSGCSEDPSCDPGQIERDGACYPSETESAAGAPADSGTSPADGTSGSGGGGQSETPRPTGSAGSAGSAGEPAKSGFGAACEGDTECTEEEAPYCAISPIDPIGFCTVTGCSTDQSLCPEGWSCNTAYMAFGAPDFCSE